jgi:hypothetical protein
LGFDSKKQDHCSNKVLNSITSALPIIEPKRRQTAGNKRCAAAHRDTCANIGQHSRALAQDMSVKSSVEPTGPQR